MYFDKQELEKRLILHSHNGTGKIKLMVYRFVLLPYYYYYGYYIDYYIIKNYTTINTIQCYQDTIYPSVLKKTCVVFVSSMKDYFHSKLHTLHCPLKRKTHVNCTFRLVNQKEMTLKRILCNTERTLSNILMFQQTFFDSIIITKGNCDFWKPIIQTLD